MIGKNQVNGTQYRFLAKTTTHGLKAKLAENARDGKPGKSRCLNNK
jgi:hypothetical protein